MIRTLLCTLLLTLAPVLAAETPAHEHEHAEQAALIKSDSGQRHATDAPLRAGMNAIHTLVANAKADAPPEALAALADGIDGEIKVIFRECKLDAEADAALHGILAALLKSVKELRQPPVATSTWDNLHQALQHYSSEFDHPGFELQVSR